MSIQTQEPEIETDETAEDQEEQKRVTLKRGDVRRLEAKAGEAERLRIENALLRGGLNLSERQVKALIAAHDGDLTPEALKATATDLGMVHAEPEETPPEPEGPDLAPGEAGSTNERAALVNGAPPDTGVDQDPRRSALSAAFGRIKDGGTEADAVGVFMQTLANAVNNGDQRAVYDPDRWVQEHQ